MMVLHLVHSIEISSCCRGATSHKNLSNTKRAEIASPPNARLRVTAGAFSPTFRQSYVHDQAPSILVHDDGRTEPSLVLSAIKCRVSSRSRLQDSVRAKDTRPRIKGVAKG